MYPSRNWVAHQIACLNLPRLAGSLFKENLWAWEEALHNPIWLGRSVLCKALLLGPSPAASPPSCGSSWRARHGLLRHPSEGPGSHFARQRSPVSFHAARWRRDQIEGSLTAWREVDLKMMIEFPLPSVCKWANGEGHVGASLASLLSWMVSSIQFGPCLICQSPPPHVNGGGGILPLSFSGGIWIQILQIGILKISFFLFFG